MRIIIVEDEIKIRSGMAKMIESQTGHVVIGEAGDGVEGLEMILRFKPDLVITDIRMPKMNGLEMIKEMSERGFLVNTVILSGYSEFEYAQQAIRYHVTDYLLKPLAPEDVVAMLSSIEARIRDEEQKRYGHAEGQLRELLFGYLENTPENVSKVCLSCGFRDDTKILILVGYIGDAPPDYRKVVEEELLKLKENSNLVNLSWFYHDNDQIYYCIAAAEARNSDEALFRIQRSFYNRLAAHYRIGGNQPVWYIAETDSDNLVGNVCRAKERLDYSLVMTEVNWITDEGIQEYKTAALVYPADIIGRIKHAVCKEDAQAIASSIDEFFEYMSGQPIDPVDMKRGFIKLYYNILDTLMDFDRPLHDVLKSANILKMLESVKTKNELRNACRDFIRILQNPEKKREDISNYVIKKAISYIREHYSEGISLEEVSRKLEITPVYLSTLFNREMGINFSVFLKQFRISHAKRLLKGSDMKIYEIAKAVGYQDPKYFTKVFKEEQGISPGDFRMSD